ncbi:MAG TPA: hypothetical protein VKQ52_04340, partial [Puia sp.]|nr:hypothetical protein [Puia sp.]
PAESILPISVGQVLANEAPSQNNTAPILAIRKDTIDHGKRILYLHCTAPQGTNSVNLAFNPDDPVPGITVDGRAPSGSGPGAGEAARQPGYRWITYHGIPPEGFDLVLELAPDKKYAGSLTARSLGIPLPQGAGSYPPGIIPSPGSISNTTLVTKKFSF